MKFSLLGGYYYPKKKERKNMAYIYSKHRQFTFTDEGQRLLLKTRDFAFRMIEQAGCVQAEKLLGQMMGGSSWDHMAVIDRLVELQDLREVRQAEDHVWQHKVYIRRG